MKTYLASTAFLISGIFFSGNPLEANGSGTNRIDTTAGGGAATNAPITDKQLRTILKQREDLDALSAQLNDLLTKYTENDKRVRAAREQIADLQKQLASEGVPILLTEGSGKNPTANATNATSRSADAPAKGSSVSAINVAANTKTKASTNVDLLASAATSGADAIASTNASVKLVSMETLDDKYRLAIGDKLSFRIEEDKHRLEFGDRPNVRSEEDDPTPLVVTDSGELEVPYIGRYAAANKTCKQLAFELKTALEKDYFYKATVILAVDLKAKTLGRVYLTGAIHVPGPEEIPSDEVLTIGKAILRAGGFTDFAERHSVRVTRKPAGSSQTKTLVVDVAKVLDKGKTELDLPLEPGDLILVPERLIRF